MIAFNEQDRVFYLDTPHTSYLLAVHESGMLRHLYYGKSISHNSQRYLGGNLEGAVSPPIASALGTGSYDRLAAEYPTFGLGDTRMPALCIHSADGARICEPVYLCHTMQPGKPPLEGLPSFSAGEQDADTLCVTLQDAVLSLRVELYYTVYRNLDLITRHARVINASDESLRLDSALSMSLDLPTRDWKVLKLTGAHAREFTIETVPLCRGTHVIESRSGSSSHQHNPFAALMAEGADEDTGEVLGVSIVYSGSFRIAAEVDQYDTTRIHAGINPFDFGWLLEPGEAFTTPEALLVFSSAGLTGMSYVFHQAYRMYLGKSRFRNQPRPIVLNSWEAFYFSFDEQKMLGFIESVKGLGVDIIVMDDGWFGERNNDCVSLGDWYVNHKKLPRGLTEIIGACHRNGMRFGLWVEPEMICENSDLYRAHPDWCIHVAGRPHTTSRNQLVLDLSRNDVVAYLLEALSSLLRENQISYIKWDMNRYLTNIGSPLLPPARQKEVAHRHILGVYRLMAALTERFPDVLFEGCSGGGGRFDFGILYYMPQIWTSDNSDAVCRARIQYGASMVYAPAAMTAHVSAVPNHQTGRTTTFRTRGDVASMCSFGYELDPGALSPEQRQEIALQVQRNRKIADLVIDGLYYRLLSPYKANAGAWQLVSPDKRRAFVLYVHLLTDANLPPRLLRLKGIDPKRRYRVSELDDTIEGDVLMNVGLPVAQSPNDFISTSYLLETCEDE